MTVDVDKHEVFVAAPDAASRLGKEAVPPPSQQKVVVPDPMEQRPGILPDHKGTVRYPGKLYGLSLAWLGLRLLGVTIGLATIWYVVSWIVDGREPLSVPIWLLAVTGTLAIISICMMVVGTQDDDRR